MTVAAETSPAVGKQITTALAAGQWQPGLLTRIAHALPEASVALAQRASNFVNLSNWQSRLGRREDALTAINQAVTIRRKLAADRPAVFMTRLKSSLTLMADALAALSREQEAETVRTEAARLA